MSISPDNLPSGTVKYTINIIVFVLTISGWGWAIKNEIAIQAYAQEQQQRQIEQIARNQKETIASLERKIELLRYDVNQLQINLAANGLTLKK